MNKLINKINKVYYIINYNIIKGGEVCVDE